MSGELGRGGRVAGRQAETLRQGRGRGLLLKQAGPGRLPSAPQQVTCELDGGRGAGGHVPRGLTGRGLVGRGRGQCEGPEAWSAHGVMGQRGWGVRWVQRAKLDKHGGRVGLAGGLKGVWENGGRPLWLGFP